MNETTGKSWKDIGPVKRVLFVLGAILILFVATETISVWKSMQYIGRDVASTHAITVSGKGEVLVTPDIATFSFSVTSEAMDVAAAQKKSTDTMNAILAYVKQSGVDDKDVKTVAYNIYPRYEYKNATVYNQGERYLAAYVVSQTVEVKVRDLTKAGTLLSGIGGQGATDVSGLSFSVDKQDEVQRQARDKAIVDARSQADLLAASLGVRLGSIISYSESTPYQPYPVYYNTKAMMVGGAADSAPQIPTGENKITSNVTITYEIR